MLRINIEIPLYLNFDMFKHVIASILDEKPAVYADGYELSVNQTGTEATVMDVNGAFFNNLTIIGTGLTLADNSYSLAGGHVTGFGYHDPNTDTGQADISGFNLGATALQGLIDGATSVAQLQDELFDNRPQNIIGSPFADHIMGGHKSDIIRGHGGDDLIFGSEGSDTIYGGYGHDTLDFSRLTDPVGVNIDLSAHTAAFGVVIQAGNLGGSTVDAGPQAGNGTDQQVIHGCQDVNGTAHADTINGDSVDNELYGGTGDDKISGGGGKDFIDGGGGNDVLYGNGANDTIIGNDGNDVIHGGAGDDSILGDLDNHLELHGKDMIFGDAGNDTIVGNSGPDVISGGDDNDDYRGQQRQRCH